MQQKQIELTEQDKDKNQVIQDNQKDEKIQSESFPKNEVKDPEVKESIEDDEDQAPPTSRGNNDKEIFYPGLDDVKFNYKPMLIFIAMYLFNATVAFPLFLFIMFRYCYHEICKKQTFLERIEVLICFLVDIYIAFSVLMMYPLALIPQKHAPLNYQYWAISCLIFLQSYILLMTYQYAFGKKPDKFEWTYLFTKENMNNLGLGKLAEKFTIKEEHYSQRLDDIKQSLDDQIQDLIENENIDRTLFYFTLETDIGFVQFSELSELTREKLSELIKTAKNKIQEQQAQLNDSVGNNSVVKHLQTQGFLGKSHVIDNLLRPHYQYISLKPHISKQKILLVILFVLILKGAYPLYEILEHQNYNSIKNELVLLSFYMGMYLNMLSILIGLVINDDLKMRKYILDVLESLILQYNLNEDDDDQINDELYEDSVFNSKYKLDLSCNLSLESWDNARRLTIALDQSKQDTYETSFAFLAIYLLYTYLGMACELLGFKIYAPINKFFKDPVQEYNMCIDFLLIGILFLTRVNQGSKYNETFSRLQETITKIAAVYEDKKSLFDFYFDSKLIQNIQNPTYRKITHRIYCTSAVKLLYQLAQKSVQEISVTKFEKLVSDNSKQRVLSLCATMEKLVAQIDFDSEHFCHKFLGLFKSDIKKTASTFMLFAYIFLHSKVIHYLKKKKQQDEQGNDENQDENQGEGEEAQDGSDTQDQDDQQDENASSQL